MILQNQVRCNKCHDTPFSTSRHDFVSCECGAISVDGGTAYLRRVGAIQECADLSIVIPDEAGEAALEQIAWAKKTGRNEFGILCAVARGLRDNGVKLVSMEELDKPIEPNSDEEWDLETACFNIYNNNTIPGEVRRVVGKLWGAFVAREKQIEAQQKQIDAQNQMKEQVVGG